MNPYLNDDEIARLPLRHGRAELLEEITSTPVLAHRAVDSAARGRHVSWLASMAVAAAVVAMAGGVAWLGADRDATRPAPGVGPAAGETDRPTQIEDGRVVLEAAGWGVGYAYADSDGGEARYELGAATFAVRWRDAASYQGYVEDRRHITVPPTDGEPIEVLGRPAQLWAYSSSDHTVIREVGGAVWFEFRGSGVGKRAFLALLDQTRQVDLTEFEAAMPPGFVDDSTWGPRVEEILGEIRPYVDPLLPMNSWRSGFGSNTVDPYQLGIDVAGQLACEWLHEYEAAELAGAQGRTDRAIDVLRSTRDWPVLQEISELGDYPDTLWQIVDQAAAGRLPADYARVLRCEG